MNTGTAFRCHWMNCAARRSITSDKADACQITYLDSQSVIRDSADKRQDTRPKCQATLAESSSIKGQKARAEATALNAHKFKYISTKPEQTLDMAIYGRVFPRKIPKIQLSKVAATAEF